MWTPRFACEACGTVLAATAANVLGCGGCHRSYERRDGIWRFLPAERRAAVARFVDQYRTVREIEGRRSVSSDYYRGLPSVPADDPHAAEWRVRQETFRHLLGHVLAPGLQPATILDVGAGSGWLSHRLAALGHHTIALDVLDDEADGLGAVRHYTFPIVSVQADFDALPFVHGQFDVVIFNGSLHYAPDPPATLAHARAMLAPEGTLVVMDSPMFYGDADGAAMVTRVMHRFVRDYRLQEVVRPASGYLTFATLAASADALRLEPWFVPSRGSLGWRMRRRLAGIRGRHRPAAFGLWAAR